MTPRVAARRRRYRRRGRDGGGETVLAAARVGTVRSKPRLAAHAGEAACAQLAADALHRAMATAAASTLRACRRVAQAGPCRDVGRSRQRGRRPAREGGGAEVVGVTLKLWADPMTDGAKACCSPEAVLGARGWLIPWTFPHLTLDLEEEFRGGSSRVRRRIPAGATPNPCIVCNGEVRIAAMIDLAERLGATHLVTGHYVRIVDDGSGLLLAAAADPAKDQSYMLAALPPPCCPACASRSTELTKPAGACDRRTARAAGGPQARESGPLLPRRPGQARVPAPQRRPAATVTATSSTSPAGGRGSPRPP